MRRDRGVREPYRARGGARLDVTFGRSRFRKALVDRGLTLIDVARSTGIPYATVLKAAGGYCQPSKTTQEATARMLGLSVKELWGD